MDSYNYEQSIWGKGEARLEWGSPTHIRLFWALRMVRFLPNHPRLLEVGCGAGQFIKAIKKYLPQTDCFGCDISATALSVAQQDAAQVCYAHHTDEHLPYESESMDGIYIFDVLEHVAQPELLLKEVYRVLKPGGMAYCFVPCEGDVLSLWHVLDVFHLKKDLTKKYAGHINYFSRKQLFSLVKQAGFHISYTRYSEHIVGQLVGIASFFMMDRWSKSSSQKQVNNEAYFAHLDRSKEHTLTYDMFQFLKMMINSFISLGAHVFSHVPSPNVHIVLKK